MGTVSSATSAEEGPSEDPPGLAAPRRGDEAGLYEQFNRRLIRKIAGRVNTTPDIIEDACAFAWVQFMRYQPSRERGWREWMITTAAREAWRLHGIEAPLYPFEAKTEEGRTREVELRDPRTSRADERAEALEALEVLAAIPERRQQAMELHVADIPRSDRAARLHDLERNPPDWLRAAIGRPNSKHGASAMLAWRRAALAIDDYRRVHGHDLGDEVLGRRPADPAAARAFDLAERAAQRVKAFRSRGLER